MFTIVSWWHSRRTWDREVMSSSPGWVTVKCLLLEWVIVCWQVSHLGIWWSSINVNSAFHPSGVGKSSACPVGWH